MTEEKRPTLTLRRKPTATDTAASAPGSEPAPVLTRTRKQTVVVSARPAWKVKKEAQEAQEKEARAAAKAARRAETLHLRAEEQAKESAALKAANRKSAPLPVYRKRMPLDEGLALLERCWPALVKDGKPQLIAVDSRTAMLEDIGKRGLDVSVKQLKRCLSTVTRSDVYLDAMVPGASRINIDGQPATPVSESEAEFARSRKMAEHSRLVRKQHFEEEQARNTPDAP